MYTEFVRWNLDYFSFFVYLFSNQQIINLQLLAQKTFGYRRIHQWSLSRTLAVHEVLKCCRREGWSYRRCPGWATPSVWWLPWRYWWAAPVLTLTQTWWVIGETWPVLLKRNVHLSGKQCEVWAYNTIASAKHVLPGIIHLPGVTSISDQCQYTICPHWRMPVSILRPCHTL